jgi:hypothetical protein
MRMAYRHLSSFPLNSYASSNVSHRQYTANDLERQNIKCLESYVSGVDLQNLLK